VSASELSRRRFLHLAGATGVGAGLGAAGLGAAGLSLTGCGGGQGSGASDDTIAFWNAVYATSSDTDKTKKRAEFWVVQATKRFADQAKQPTKVTDLPGDLPMFTKFRAAGVARNGPDLATLWSGAYILGVKDFLEPLDEYFTAEERAKLTGWAAVTEGFDEGKGTIYGVPSGTDGICVLYFDRRALEKAGAEVGDTGLEWDAWIDLLDRIKASGVTPLALGKYNYSAFSLLYWVAQVTGGEAGFHQLASGKRDFSDPAIEDVLTKWLQLVDYTLPGAPTMDGGQAQSRLAAGKAAAVVEGAWAIPDLRETLGDNVVMTPLPNIGPSVAVKDTGIGGPGGAIVVTNYSEHKEQAVDLIKHLVSPEEQKRRVEGGEVTPIPNAVGLDPTSIYSDPLYQQQFRWVNDKFVFYADNIWPTELVDEFLAQAQLAWGGKIPPAELLSRLDEKRDEIVAKK
jgi:raffinose/stachyose/melibiose transport system substrate-binding protein